MPAPALRDLRELRAADRAPIAALLRATAAFTEEEVGVALELVDVALSKRVERPDDYRFLVADAPDGTHGARVAGYVCWGLASMSDGVFDVYWIAVDPTLQRHGIGACLLRAVEEDVARRGGRTILIETGGKESYAPTRRFYERAGYAEAARIPDFFRVGDDKVTFMRRVARPGP
jgi:ribosomal protein S18 acetylase RimI-like enzyme